MTVRSDAVGLTRDQTSPSPLSHAELQSATSLSPIHISRTVQKLRADGLFGTRGGNICIEQWAALCLTGDFDPAYPRLRNHTTAVGFALPTAAVVRCEGMLGQSRPLRQAGRGRV